MAQTAESTEIESPETLATTRSTLTSQRVITTAVALADVIGVDALTIRKLAGEAERLEPGIGVGQHLAEHGHRPAQSRSSRAAAASSLRRRRRRTRCEWSWPGPSPQASGRYVPKDQRFPSESLAV